ncbi:dermonecrotic toxin domain-containing protein [Pseudomonas brassicacearum]|uniref:dermonecrotic toxin domain-containing protein n=1 Tax=Pseudomonas brassicacearum TaxID=930166 RepID=UPI001E06DEFF|nr:DUF6543 domain-containing protein [Pseudomonas brassicacearum]CAH0274808.1 hypothetical protein SRABI06_03772 [Pseudomonas brassicacearum]
MPTSPAVPSDTKSPRPLRDDEALTSLALSVHLLFSSRPTLVEAARFTLQEVFDERYPTLGICAANAVILEPQWRVEAGQQHLMGYSTHGLTDLLLERCRGAAARTFSQASFLAKSAGMESPRKESVALSDIQQMLSEWAPLLLDCYQQCLVAFWSTGVPSVWRQLSDLFRAQLRQAASGLVGEELATVQAVLDYPDNALRQRAPGHAAATQACITFVYDGDSSSPHPDDVLVMSMTRHSGEQEIALLYTLSGGIERFSSVSAREASWFGLPSARHWTLRNYTPEHDIFDALTFCLLERQLQLIAAIKPADFVDSASLERRVAQISSPGLLLGAFRSGHESRLSALWDRLPAWLQNASLVDRSAYSRLLSSLATLHRKNCSFMTGIPGILEFAEQALKEKMLEDDRTRTDIRVSDIEVTVSRLTNTSFEIADPPFPPPTFERETQAFAQRAIKNLGAFPLVPSTITYQGGEPPAWMTYDYLRDLTSRADIGKHYPKLLQRRLLDDPLERARRQKHFSDSLGILLPLLALELKIKKSLTDLAYQYLVAVLQPATSHNLDGGHEPVIRPLAFLSHADATPDRVSNQFVIGPKNVDQGPQVLYRPASPMPLIEFASCAALFTAIKTPGALQESVLAGLAPSARPVYANGGFQEPHIGRLVVSDFDSPPTPDPALLADEPLQGDIAGALYQACAQALIDQARQACVSDSQARWDSFKQFGWVAFNLLSPLFDGPVAMIGLLVQLTASLDELVQGERAENRWEAMAGVLMSLALVLVHGGARLRDLSGLDERPLAGEGPGIRPVPLDNAITPTPVSPVSATPFGAKARLVYGWSSPHARFSARELASLDSFKLSAPAAVQGLVRSGEYKGLYQQGSLWFAFVEGDWYQVSRKLEGVVVIDATHPARTGPWLEHDGQGRWKWGYGLRLLGGAGGLSTRAAKKLKSLEKKGRDLLATLSQRIGDARWLAESGRPPSDVEDLIVGKSTEFSRCADEIAQLTQSLGDQVPLALIDALEAAAERLRRLGRTTRIGMVKSKLPDVGAVEYLLEEQEISIRRVGDRVDISGGKGADFLQEYEIRDRHDNRVLWYAHFHYLKKDAAAQDFSKAHLKTSAQRGRGLDFQRAQQQSGQAVDRIWRANIGSAAARAFFLSL